MNHKHYHHQKPLKRKFSFFQKVMLFWAFVLTVFFTYFTLDMWQTSQLGKTPRPLSYGQIVEKKDECTKAGLTWTVWMNAKNSKVVGVTCEGTKL